MWAALALAMVLSGCGAEGGTAQMDAAAVAPVRPVPVPYGMASAPAPVPGAPAGSAYRTGWHGYDASFPQCRAGRRPAGADFSVIGVNGGKTFTVNRCLASLWRSADRPRALYLNSGYTPANRGRITPGCRSLGERVHGKDALGEAYALGCSATVHSLRALRAAGIGGTPTMWWIDVERLNSWSERRLDLNRYALQGQIDQLAATGHPVGIYSSARDWLKITGGWAPGGVDATWVAGSTPQAACAATGFTGDPVWLVQEAATWPHPSNYDSDIAC
jgi:hypothetical protein